MKGDLGDTRPPALHRTTVWQRNLPAARRVRRVSAAVERNRRAAADAFARGECLCGSALAPGRRKCPACLAAANEDHKTRRVLGPKALRPCGCGSRGMHRASCPERAAWEAAKAR